MKFLVLGMCFRLFHCIISESFLNQLLNFFFLVRSAVRCTFIQISLAVHRPNNVFNAPQTWNLSSVNIFFRTELALLQEVTHYQYVVD